jgi:hypothetical protein
MAASALTFVERKLEETIILPLLYRELLLLLLWMIALASRNCFLICLDGIRVVSKQL